jgi:hypothetical protein
MMLVFVCLAVASHPLSIIITDLAGACANVPCIVTSFANMVDMHMCQWSWAAVVDVARCSFLTQ